MFDSQCDLAALVYEQDQGPDKVLQDFASDLKACGYRAVGLVQLGHHCLDAPKLSAILVHTGEELQLFQNLGACATGCRLDVGQLLDAGSQVANAIDQGADLVVNRFGRQEREGKGLSFLRSFQVSRRRAKFQSVSCLWPHSLQANFTRVAPLAAETRFGAPHFPQVASMRVLPCFTTMALRSMVSRIRRSASSRIDCFDIRFTCHENRHGSSLITPASQFFDSDREKSPLKPRIAAVPIVTRPPALMPASVAPMPARFPWPDRLK